jgi:hypothetical protein
MDFKSDRIWGDRVLVVSLLSELAGCREVGGAFSLSADWEGDAVFWLETLPGCEAALACVGTARCGEGGRCDGDV